MSKIKTVENLVDRFSDQTRLRKHELISVRQLLPPATREPANFSLRLSPVIAYAHWEGYIKESSVAYLEYVARKSVRLSRLRPNFQALACRSEILGSHNAIKRIAPHLKVIGRLVDDIDESVLIPTNAVDTESNLNWEVFENICSVVGVSTESYWSQQRGLIDDLFLTRCDIAHGQLVIPSPGDAVRYLEFALEAIQRFTNDLENAAITNSHLRPLDAM